MVGIATGGTPTEIGSLITSADRGDAEALFTALYAELHPLARRELARNVYATLGTITLLHEAYLDISGRSGAVFPDRARFMTYASRVMRGLIISYVRTRQAQKRGGRFELTTISDAVANAPDGHGLQRLSDALDELAATDPLFAGRRPRVLLRVLPARDRGDARRLGAHGAAGLGEGPVLT